MGSIEVDDENQFGLKSYEIDTRTEYLVLPEAVCLIAFSSLDFPPVGVKTYLDMMLTETDEGLEYANYQGRYDLARDQLLNAAATGLIPLYGRIENVRHRSFGDPKESSQQTRVRTEPISVEALKAGDYYEEDGKYCIGDVWYDLVAVDLGRLKEVFKTILFEPGVLLEEAGVISDIVEMAQNARKSLGRPPKWKWEEIMLEVTLLADTIDGLPETQAEMERWVADLCQKKYGSEPSASSIRSKIAPLYERKRKSPATVRLTA